jgi:transglutaminase-like putative cysteine protease
MRYRVTHTTKYVYSERVSVCHNKLHLAPRKLTNQSVSDFKLLISPEPSEVWQHVDYFGNQVDYFSLQDPHRSLSVTAVSQIVMSPLATPLGSPSWEQVRSEMQLTASQVPNAYYYAFPSTLVPTSSEFRAFASQSFTNARPIIESSMDLTRRIFEEFEFNPQATTVSTPVDEVLRKRAGVCQDFAHLQLACLRSIGLAARYVSGYLRTLPPPGKARLIGADASHAWISLFCGAEIGWIDFDPTNNTIPETDHITVGWGRDYSDVCPIQGVFIGGGQHAMHVSVDVATDNQVAL